MRSLSSTEVKERLTLSDGSRSDLGQLDEHEVTELLDLLLVAQTGENLSKVLVDLDLLKTGIEKGVHALIGGLRKSEISDRS